MIAQGQETAGPQGAAPAGGGADRGSVGEGGGRGAVRGFTLIEVMIVVTIIGLLATLVLGVSRDVLRRIYEHETAIMLKAVMIKVKDYRDQDPNGNWPTATSAGDTAAMVDDLNLKLANTDIAGTVGKTHFLCATCAAAGRASCSAAPPGSPHDKGGRLVDAWGTPVLYFSGAVTNSSGNWTQAVANSVAFQATANGQPYTLVRNQVSLMNGSAILASYGPDLTPNTADDVLCPTSSNR